MSYMSSNSLLPGPFSLNLPENLKYGKLLPYFLSIEEQNNYNKNKKKLGSQWHYFHKDVRYDLNSNYYRAPEWNSIDWKESIVIFGCSHVFGEGLAHDETVAYQLEQLVNRPVINLGQSGTSTIFSWHNSLKFFEMFGTPYAVIQLWTEYSRLLFYDTFEVKRVGFWSGGRWDDYNKDMKKLYQIWNKHDVHPSTFFKFEAMAAKDFWSNKTRYYQGSFFESTARVLNIDHFDKIDDARDFIHFGPKSHCQAAITIFNNIKTLT